MRRGGRKFVGEFLREAKFWEYREVEGTILVLPGIMKDKTMDDTLKINKITLLYIKIIG